MARLEHGHHLRLGRFSQVGQIYSVTSITEQRRLLFGDWRIGRLVVDEFQRTDAQGLTSSLAWVIMPDHFIGYSKSEADRLIEF
jgi:putative transposase